jgi:predicted transcriptional regulator
MARISKIPRKWPRVPVALRLPKDVVDGLDAISEATDQTRTDLIERASREALARWTVDTSTPKAA